MDPLDPGVGVHSIQQPNLADLALAMTGFFHLRLRKMETLDQYFERASQLRDHLVSFKVDISDHMLTLAIINGLPAWIYYLLRGISIGNQPLEEILTPEMIQRMLSPHHENLRNVGFPINKETTEPLPNEGDELGLNRLSNDIPLPDELLSLIFLYVAASSLFHCTPVHLVCRRWNEVAIRRFSIVVIREEIAWRYIPFNRTLTEFPSQGKFVRTCQFEYIPFELFPHIYAILQKLDSLLHLTLVWGADVYPAAPPPDFAFPRSLIFLKLDDSRHLHSPYQDKEELKEAKETSQLLLHSLGGCTVLGRLLLKIPYVVLPPIALPALRELEVRPLYVGDSFAHWIESFCGSVESLKNLFVTFSHEILDTADFGPFIRLFADTLVSFGITICSAMDAPDLMSTTKSWSLPPLPKAQYLELIFLSNGHSVSLDEAFPFLFESTNLSNLVLCGNVQVLEATANTSRPFKLETLDLSRLLTPPQSESRWQSLFPMILLTESSVNTLTYLSIPSWLMIENDVAATLKFVHQFTSLKALVVSPEFSAFSASSLLPEHTQSVDQISPVIVLSDVFPFVEGFLYFQHVEYLRLPFSYQLLSVLTDMESWRYLLPKLRGLWINFPLHIDWRMERAMRDELNRVALQPLTEFAEKYEVELVIGLDRNTKKMNWQYRFEAPGNPK
ncbi:hypothetical protein BT69DRAFT_1315271 [Atractiella rhizophila]|nr:hypothetical protein BT69DRAFT_1315271 [Atractiella rhizophila]